MRSSQVATAFAVAALTLLPALAIIFELGRSDTLTDIPAVEVPLVASPTIVEALDRTPVTVSVERAEPPVVLAPQWSGTVTALYVTADEDIESGDAVAQVDGLDRIAVASSVPFYRSLSAGDRGDDVAALQSMLRESGFNDVVVNGFLDDATAQALSRWSQDVLGAPQLVGNEVVTFDPATVVWLPESPMRPGSVEGLIVGSPAPGPGSVIIRGVAPVAAATLRPLDPEDSLQSTQSGSWVLEVKNEVVPLIDGSPELNTLSRIAGEQEELNGEVRRADPLALLAVPPRSVRSGAQGEYCVWVQRPNGYEEVSVELAQGRSGQTLLVDSSVNSEMVLVNPDAILDGRGQCS